VPCSGIVDERPPRTSVLWAPHPPSMSALSYREASSGTARPAGHADPAPRQGGNRRARTCSRFADASRSRPRRLHVRGRPAAPHCAWHGFPRLTTGTSSRVWATPDPVTFPRSLTTSSPSSHDELWGADRPSPPAQTVGSGGPFLDGEPLMSYALALGEGTAGARRDTRISRASSPPWRGWAGEELSRGASLVRAFHRPRAAATR